MINIKYIRGSISLDQDARFGTNKTAIDFNFGVLGEDCCGEGRAEICQSKDACKSRKSRTETRCKSEEEGEISSA